MQRQHPKLHTQGFWSCPETIFRYTWPGRYNPKWGALRNKTVCQRTPRRHIQSTFFLRRRIISPFLLQQQFGLATHKKDHFAWVEASSEWQTLASVRKNSTFCRETLRDFNLCEKCCLEDYCCCWCPWIEMAAHQQRSGTPPQQNLHLRGNKHKKQKYCISFENKDVE